MSLVDELMECTILLTLLMPLLFPKCFRSSWTWPTMAGHLLLPVVPVEQVALVWQGGNGIDELCRGDFEAPPNALSALRTRLGRRDSSTQFRAVSPPR